MFTGHSPDNIELGNTLNDDQFPVDTFTYCISNPPYGVDYSEEYEDVLAEHEDGEHGRFASGIPRKSDGQLLFLLHMISKLPKDRPGRIAVIMNGSPLFNGDASGGESEIRRLLMEEDMVDAIIALPTDLFYNTGIATYIWIVTNCKRQRGQVRLIDASSRWPPCANRWAANGGTHRCRHQRNRQPLPRPRGRRDGQGLCSGRFWLPNLHRTPPAPGRGPQRDRARPLPQCQRSRPLLPVDDGDVWGRRSPALEGEPS